MGTLKGFAPPFGPPPATSSPLASPFGDFGTCTFPTTPARYARALALGLAKPSRDGTPPAKPAGSPRSGNRIRATTRKGVAAKHAAQGQVPAPHHTPPVHGFFGIDRTRRREATDRTDGRRDGGSVTPQERARETAGYPTAMRGFKSHGIATRTRSSLSSSAVRWYVLCAVAERAMTTRSVPPGADEAIRR